MRYDAAGNPYTPSELEDAEDSLRSARYWQHRGDILPARTSERLVVYWQAEVDRLRAAKRAVEWREDLSNTGPGEAVTSPPVEPPPPDPGDGASTTSLVLSEGASFRCGCDASSLNARTDGRSTT